MSGQFCGTSGDYQPVFRGSVRERFDGFGTWHGKKVAAGPVEHRASRAAYVTFSRATPRGGGAGGRVVRERGRRPAEHRPADAPGWSIAAPRGAGHDGVEPAPRSGPGQRGRPRSTSEPSTPSSTTRCWSPTSSTTPTATTSASTARCTWRPDTPSTPTSRGGTSIAARCSSLALLAPQQTSDMVTSLLADAAQGGGLPKWPVANLEAAQVNGDSADAVHRLGLCLRGPGLRRPTGPGRHGAGGHRSHRRPATPSRAPGPVRSIWPRGTSQAGVLRRHVAALHRGRVETLEYAIDDFAISQLAQAAGDTAASRHFLARAQNWRNLVNPATGYLAARRRQRDISPGPAFQRSPHPGHRPGRVRRGQRHPVHLERAPEPARACSSASVATGGDRGQAQHVLHKAQHRSKATL